MIVLNLKDGLGNQLFEYAYVLYLQNMYPEDTILINPYSYRAKGYKGYALPYFRLSKEIKELPQNKQRLFYYKFLFRLCLRFGLRIFSLRKAKRHILEDSFVIGLGKHGLYLSFKAFEYYPVQLTTNTIKYVHGNYEHYDYVKANLSRLRKELVVQTPLSARDERLIREFQSVESVCVHIRRGDYLDPQWAQLNVCTFQYYNRAMNYIAEKVPNAVFYIYSNTPSDIEWIQEHFHFQQSNIRYVTYGCPDYDEFRLMMSCKHFIISNSTFSWWAALLSDNEHKIVVSPSRWSKTSTPQGLILNSFVKIDVE